jgi:integrase
VFRGGQSSSKLTTIFTTMKVTIENHRNLLRLRFNDGKRRCLPLGVTDSPIGRSLALQRKAEIELDWQTGHYDKSLLKYRPRTLGKTATEVSAPELFAKFTKAQAKEENLLPSTVKHKYRAIERQLEKYLNLPAISITKQTAGKLADIWDKNISPDTARQRAWLLTSCWDWAKGRYHIAEENPWKDMGRRFGRQPKNKLDPFDLDEVNSILTGFQSNPEFSHYADFVAFLLGIGCRIGEGIGIRWANVAKDFKSVYICEAISKGVVGDTKTKDHRDVAISPSIAAMLKRRKESQQPKPSDLVFTSPKGCPIDRDNFRSRVWEKVLENAGVRYRPPGKTRSTAVSHSLAGGANYIAVAKATGHSPLVMHKNYAGLIDKKSVFVEFGNVDKSFDNQYP